jgi:adenylate cyclase
MGRDEAGTLSTLKDYRSAMAAFIQRHNGRVVNTTGDSLMAAFDSVVEAVSCAAEIQQELAVRNGNKAEDRRMEFRIGINLGDVIVDGDDFYGEGVNIAARLEGLAEPGGICISGTAYDQVKNKLTLGYDFLGEQSVKNISDEVPVYRVYRDVETKEKAARAGPSPGEGVPPAPARGKLGPKAVARFRYQAGRMGIVVAVLFVIDVLSGPGWWFLWPALAVGCYLAFKAQQAFGPGMGLSKAMLAGHAHAHDWNPRELRFGDLEGGTTIEKNTRLFGSILGDAAVADGVSFKMTGTIEGDLTIGRGADVRMVGTVLGDVIDQGGSLHIIGTVEGQRRTAAAV